MKTVTLEFKLDELIGYDLLLLTGGEYVEGKIKQIRRGRVQIITPTKDKWVDEDNLEVVDILKL